jgi:hypothetical protein
MEKGETSPVNFGFGMKGRLLSPRAMLPADMKHPPKEI